MFQVSCVGWASVQKLSILRPTKVVVIVLGAVAAVAQAARVMVMPIVSV